MNDLYEAIGEALDTLLEWINEVKTAIQQWPIFSQNDKKGFLYTITIELYTKIIVPTLSSLGIPPIIIHIATFLLCALVLSGPISKIAHWIQYFI